MSLIIFVWNKFLRPKSLRTADMNSEMIKRGGIYPAMTVDWLNITGAETSSGVGDDQV